MFSYFLLLIKVIEDDILVLAHNKLSPVWKPGGVKNNQ